MYKEESSRNMALHHLIEKYQQKLYWQIRKAVIDEVEADEAMANPVSDACKGLDTFRAEAIVSTWL
mgnify:CR=1 FL=1